MIFRPFFSLILKVYFPPVNYEDSAMKYLEMRGKIISPCQIKEIFIFTNIPTYLNYDDDFFGVILKSNYQNALTSYNALQLN